MTTEEAYHHQSILLQTEEESQRRQALQWIAFHLDDAITHIETLSGGWQRMLERTRL